MTKPADQKLYDRVKRRVYAKMPQHSAYRSGHLVKAYKAAFSKSHGARKQPYVGTGTKPLRRWFKEKWVDVSRKDKDGKHPPCGRTKAKKGRKGYPKCRPSVKVSSKTPKTSGSMTEGEKRAATKRKRAKRQGVGGKPTIVKGWVGVK